MRPSLLRRVASFGLALVLFGATSPLQLHAHADHAADEAHVEHAHGGHDAVVMRNTDDGAVGGKVVLRLARAEHLCAPAPAFQPDMPRDAVTDPPHRPPDLRSSPRAPPALT